MPKIISHVSKNGRTRLNNPGRYNEFTKKARTNNDAPPSVMQKLLVENRTEGIADEIIKKTWPELR